MITISENIYLSNESLILKSLRQNSGLTIKEVCEKSKLSQSAIKQMESSRMRLSWSKIKILLELFGVSSDEFREYKKGRSLPIDLQDKCFVLIEKLGEVDLRTAYMFLSVIGSISIN